MARAHGLYGITSASIRFANGVRSCLKGDGVAAGCCKPTVSQNSPKAIKAVTSIFICSPDSTCCHLVNELLSFPDVQRKVPAITARLQSITSFKGSTKSVAALEADRIGDTLNRLIRQSQTFSSLS